MLAEKDTVPECTNVHIGSLPTSEPNLFNDREKWRQIEIRQNARTLWLCAALGAVFEIGRWLFTGHFF